MDQSHLTPPQTHHALVASAANAESLLAEAKVALADDFGAKLVARKGTIPAHLALGA